MAEKDAVRRSYDELADVYAAQRDDGGRGMAVLERFLESLEARQPSAGRDEPARVLDAGCGQGVPVLARLTERTAAVGLDFSAAQLRLAAENASDAALVAGDLTDLPFAQDSFDGLVAYWSLIHVPLADHQAAVDEFARVLRPGGRALVCEGTTEWVGENPDWLDSGVEMQWEIAGAATTSRQLRDAGFRIDRSWGVPETLAVDGDENQGDDDADDEGDEDDPWTFFDARLEAE